VVHGVLSQWVTAISVIFILAETSANAFLGLCYDNKKTTD